MTFDLEKFKASAIDTASRTTYPAMAVGEYSGPITKAELVGGESSNGPWLRYDVEVELTDPRTSRSKNIRLGWMLDLTDEGELDPERNIMLGQFRKALKMNGAGFRWEAPLGHFITVVLGHRPDKNDPERVYETPKGWKAAA